MRPAVTSPTFLVDADVFIAAKNRYYAFDICPGFWNSLETGIEEHPLSHG